VINASSGRSNSSENLIPQRVLTSIPRTFRLALLEKDIAHPAVMAEDLHARTPVISLTARGFMKLAKRLGEQAGSCRSSEDRGRGERDRDQVDGGRREAGSGRHSVGALSCSSTPTRHRLSVDLGDATLREISRSMVRGERSSSDSRCHTSLIDKHALRPAPAFRIQFPPGGRIVPALLDLNNENDGKPKQTSCKAESVQSPREEENSMRATLGKKNRRIRIKAGVKKEKLDKETKRLEKK